VLLADDHLPFLESVIRLLTPFDVVGMAADGRQALDLAGRLGPDVVVLDVSMPGLNGFQTLEQLRRDGSNAKVVFLTMHGDEEFVAEAIRGGAHAYVLKSRIHEDLISAIDHALAGRLFLPSLTSLSTVAGSRHTVLFHANDIHFLDGVSRLVGATLRSGEQVVMVANEATRTGVSQRLQARRLNLAELTERGQYIAQDSTLALSQVIRQGQPDKERLAEMIYALDLLRQAGPNGPRSRLTLFGDMATILCRRGQFEAAQALELMWDEMTRGLPFLTVCSYSSDCFDYSQGREQRSNVCAVHSAVTSGTSRGARAIN
jgi:DNA-binding NarL/FixJ family response regulator